MGESPKLSCTVCEAQALVRTLSFGKQPPSNRFLLPKVDEMPREELSTLSLGYCEQCGTIQHTDRMRIQTIRPRFEWLIYNEPEGHLDEVARKLVELPGVENSSRFLGITYKDKSTLERIEHLGFPQTSYFSQNDLDSSGRPFGLETIQEMLSKDSNIARLKEIYGMADVIIARHVIEHASSTSKLIASLRGLLAPGGYMVFELPDSEKIFRACNHAFIWEEHISYFTKTSLENLAQIVGAELIWTKQFSYPYEDSLVATFRFGGVKQVSQDPLKYDHEESALVLKRFSESLPTYRDKWQTQLESYHEKGEKVAVFGAGHLAAKFINFYGLKSLINCVVDDHPEKVGLMMPGSALKIVSSEELTARGIKICISTLNPESEARVKKKLSDYFDSGGEFISAFTSI